MSEVSPHIERIAGWISVGVRQQVQMAELPTVFGPAFERVSAAVTAAGVTITGPAYACYFGTPTEVVDLEIGFGVGSSMKSGEVTVTRVPAVEAVVGTHNGTYDRLADSYDQMIPWMAEHKIVVADHMYEFYDVMPDDESRATAITRLVFPLA